MSVIEGVLREEKERNLMMQEMYREEISRLPKGSISERKLASGSYYYLSFREGARVVHKYVGKNKEDADKVQKDLDKRKHFQGLLKELKAELKMIERTIK